MDFALTQTQRELAAAARRYLADTYPIERVAAMADGDGIATDTWPELTRQGWLDPSLGMVELGLLAQESGYALHPAPWWTTAALTGRAEPSTLATGDFAVTEGPADPAGGRPKIPKLARQMPIWPRSQGAIAWQVPGSSAAAGVHLTGRATLVPDAGSATTFIVEAGGAFFAVARRDAEVRELASLDRLRRMYEVDLRDAPATAVEAPARERVTALMACEAVGVAARAMDFAVDYAHQREQFGRPIGSFQAVAHQLAQGYVELELARSLAYRAAWLTGAGAHPDELEPALAGALIVGRQAAVGCCEVALQTLGGMGMTWEHPIHLWYRRALWLQANAFGMSDPHATLAAQLLDITAVEA